MTYEKIDRNGAKSFYRIVSKMNVRNHTGEWAQYNSAKPEINEEPVMIYPIAIKNNILFAKKQMYLLLFKYQIIVKF